MKSLENSKKDQVKRPWAENGDVINNLGLNLRKEYKHVAMLSSFCDQMGQILPRKVTGLTKINQKLASKAIKRARSMGFMGYTYRMKIDI